MLGIAYGLAVDELRQLGEKQGDLFKRGELNTGESFTSKFQHLVLT
jgi:hypothetical protein